MTLKTANDGSNGSFNERNAGMNRRNLIAAALTVPLLVGCVYGKYFDIDWDEEVLLHDGRMIIVHIKRTYERLSKFAKWHGLHRDTEISFDAGGKIGRFTKKFERYDVDFLENKDGNWYIYLVSTTGTPPVKLVDWAVGFLILSSSGDLQKAISWSQLPKEFMLRNIMPATPDSDGISQFHGTLLSNTVKQNYWRLNPGGAGDDGVLRRPL